MENNESEMVEEVAQPEFSLQDLMSHAKKLDESLEEEAQKQARIDAMAEFGLVDKKSGKNAALYADIDQLKAQLVEKDAEIARLNQQIVQMEMEAVAKAGEQPASGEQPTPAIPPFAPKPNPFAG